MMIVLAAGATGVLGARSLQVEAAPRAPDATPGAATGSIAGESPREAATAPSSTNRRNRPPVAKCTDRILTADRMCRAPASINDGSFDPDKDQYTCTQAPAGPFGPGKTTVTLTCTDSHGASSSCTATVTVVDRTLPTITCPADQRLECNNGRGGATATFTARASDTCDPNPTIVCTPPSGSTFPLGATTAVCSATDDSGNISKCSHKITVVDTKPPTVTTTTPAPLWPPNHKYHRIDLDDCITSIQDACRGRLEIASHAKITGCTSNEPDLGLGSGDFPNDCVIVNSHSVNARAERSGSGTGRVYTIRYRITDDSNNATNGTCKVTVPHSQGG